MAYAKLKRNKKGSLRPRDVLILTLIVSLVVSSAYIFIGDMNVAYDANITTDFETSLDKSQEIDDTTQGIYDKLKDSKGTVDTLVTLIVDGTWAILHSVLVSFEVIGDLIGSVFFDTKLGLVGGFVFTAIILATIVFTILGAVYKRDL